MKKGFSKIYLLKAYITDDHSSLTNSILGDRTNNMYLVNQMAH